MVGPQMSLVSEAMDDLGIDPCELSRVELDAGWKAEPGGLSWELAAKRAEDCKRGPDWLVVTGPKAETDNLAALQALVEVLLAAEGTVALAVTRGQPALCNRAAGRHDPLGQLPVTYQLLEYCELELAV